jgi:hypothetical protein
MLRFVSQAAIATSFLRLNCPVHDASTRRAAYLRSAVRAAPPSQNLGDRERSAAISRPKVAVEEPKWKSPSNSCILPNREETGVHDGLLDMRAEGTGD